MPSFPNSLPLQDTSASAGVDEELHCQLFTWKKVTKTFLEQHCITTATRSSICLSFARAEGYRPLSPAGRMNQATRQHDAASTNTLPWAFVRSPITITENFKHHKVTREVVQPMLWPEGQLQTLVGTSKQITSEILQASKHMNCGFGHRVANARMVNWHSG